MKKFLVVLIALVVVVLVIGVTKDAIIKASIEKGIGLVTGLKLNIRSINIGIFRPVVDIKNLTLANPAGFPDRTMMDMSEMYVHYDLPAIMGCKAPWAIL